MRMVQRVKGNSLQTFNHAKKLKMENTCGKLSKVSS